MISFDTFVGEAHGVIDELKDGTIKDDELPRRRSSRRSSRRRSRRSETHDTTPKLFGPASSIDGTDDDFSDDSADQASKPPLSAPHSNNSNSSNGNSGDSRVQNWFQLLSLKNHTGDARRALVQRLLGVNNVNELVLSKATQDQIASAANDAITDEILATVDQEDQRRKSSVSGSGSGSGSGGVSSVSDSVALIVSGGPNQYSTYRVLELVDVLDSTTGGMVKRILTNVRRRATPVSQQHSSAVSGGGGRAGFSASRKTEFCGFCLDYRSHNTTQHKCRICGALGQHRSQYCTQPKVSTPKTSSPSPNGTSGVSTPRSRRRNGGQQTPTQLPPSSAKAAAAASEEDDALTTASRLTPDASDKSFCTFCSTWGFHSTDNHRCRICGVKGVHRSRNCAKKSSGEGYRWRGSPAEPPLERKHCDLCGTLRGHSTEEHRCRICLKLGEHRSKNCPMHSPSSPATTVSPGVSARPPSSRGRRTPRSGNLASLSFCSFCGKDVTHKSEEHICRLCRVTGLHRSGDCPSRGMVSSSSQSVLSYSVKVRDRVLESIPLVLPASATTLVFDSIDKVGDVDTILKRTLQRIGVWGGGSQTPITTPYAAPSAASQPRSVRQSFVDASLPQPPLPALENVDGSGVYVISYAEGRSVIPERVLKYMRLLMHHEISTNAFSVVVVFDPSPSTWELQKPGMVTPRSLPSSPTMSEQLKKRMAKYTLQTLLGTRDKLVKLVVAQKKMQMQLQDQQQQQQRVQATQAPATATASS